MYIARNYQRRKFCGLAIKRFTLDQGLDLQNAIVDKNPFYNLCNSCNNGHEGFACMPKTLVLAVLYLQAYISGKSQVHMFKFLNL